MTGWKKVGDVDARRSAGGLMLPWSSVFVVRLTPSYLLQYIAAAVAVAAYRTPLLFWSSREPHGIFTKTLGLHSCSHQTAVAACCRYCSCCFYTLANKVAIVVEFPIFYVNQYTSTKGQIILWCPYEIIVYPKIATKKFPRFLPWPLRRGQIKKLKALYYTN